MGGDPIGILPDSGKIDFSKNRRISKNAQKNKVFRQKFSGFFEKIAVLQTHQNPTEAHRSPHRPTQTPHLSSFQSAFLTVPAECRSGQKNRLKWGGNFAPHHRFNVS
jgi:hypothetical protein